MEDASTLSDLQSWFARSIGLPLPMDYRGNPLAVSAPQLGASARARLRGGKGMDGFDRLGVYNQQYWFRLINIMQGEYPCALHVMGLRNFNQWLIRYLEACPPASPFLSTLDAAFPGFLEQNYREPTREAALEAAAYDRAYSAGFDAPEGCSLKDAGLAPGADPLAMTLVLAPHATPLRLDYQWSAYREECRADDSLEKSIELMAAKEWVVVHRSGMTLEETAVTPGAYKLLRELITPARLPEIFDRLENRLPPKEQEDMEVNLSQWFQEWVSRGWLCLAEEVAESGEEATASDG